MPSAKNKRKRPYQPEVTGKANKARRVRTEINKANKKLVKLLKRREEKKLKKNQDNNQKYQDNNGQWQTKKVKFAGTRYQGIAPDSERHNKLKSHIQRLKNDLKRIAG